MKPSVLVVLVNWNGLNDTLECLKSLAHVDYPHSVVVVDNASSGSEASAIRAAYPQVTVLQTKRNLGFTGGNNLGISYALAQGADYVLCLNNDTVVAPDFLSLMVEAAEANPKAGIVTSAIYLHAQPECLAALGCWVALEKAAPVGHITAVPEAVLNSPATVEVPFAEGCVLMMRRAVAEQTKGFDNKFFAYTEDADLCLRAREKGWTCIAVPRAHVWHKVEGGIGKGVFSPSALYYYNRNVWRLVRKHGTRAQRRQFAKASLDYLLYEWYHCVVHHDSLTRASFSYQFLMLRTVGSLNALFHCYGGRSRWSRLNAFAAAAIETLFCMTCKIRRPLIFVYQTARKFVQTL